MLHLHLHLHFARASSPPALTCRALPRPDFRHNNPESLTRYQWGFQKWGLTRRCGWGGMGWLTEISKGCIGATLRSNYTPKQVKTGPSSAEPWELLDPFFLRPAPTLPRQHMAWSDICPKDWHTCQMVAVAEAPTSRIGGNFKLDSPMTPPGRVD